MPALLHHGAGMQVDTHVTGSLLLVIAGGLLVGFGTRLGNGCTPGQRVCGISRLSRRGIIAALVYVAAGGLVVAGLRVLIGGL